MIDASRMIQVEKSDVASATKPARIRGVVRVALDLEDLPVLYIGKNTTILMTEVAGGFLDLDPRSVNVYGF
jgi:hypothetical protein